VKVFNFILRLALGGIFIAAGVIKIIDPSQFSADIANYRMLPHEWINLLAITLPWVEVAAGLLLITGPWKRASALAIMLMMVVFLAAISQATARGLNIKCGCFGTVEGRKVGLIALAEDFAMFAGALWLTWRETDSCEHRRSSSAPPC
jgi:putative oxidoreductase